MKSNNIECVLGNRFGSCFGGGGVKEWQLSVRSEPSLDNSPLRYIPVCQMLRNQTIIWNLRGLQDSSIKRHQFFCFSSLLIKSSNQRELISKWELPSYIGSSLYL